MSTCKTLMAKKFGERTMSSVLNSLLPLSMDARYICLDLAMLNA